jgi:hypothetical protein
MQYSGFPKTHLSDRAQGTPTWLHLPGSANSLVCAKERIALDRPAAKKADQREEMENQQKWTISKESRSTEQV